MEVWIEHGEGEGEPLTDGDLGGISLNVCGRSEGKLQMAVSLYNNPGGGQFASQDINHYH